MNEEMSKDDILEILESLYDNYNFVNAPGSQRVATALRIVIQKLRDNDLTKV